MISIKRGLQACLCPPCASVCALGVGDNLIKKKKKSARIFADMSANKETKYQR